MEIKTVSIIGAGAVGAVVADGLSSYLGKETVQVLAEGERLERYRRDGLFLDGKKLDFNYVEPANAKTADLVIIATKNLQLEQALEMIKTSVGADTIILSLLNGIQSERDIEAVYGKSHVLYSFVISLNSIHEENKIRCSNRGCLVFGEYDNSKTARVKALCELFEKSGIKFKNPDDIHLEQWRKYLINVTVNTLSALCRSTYGGFKIPEMQELTRQAGKEVVAVANAEGVSLSAQDSENTISLICKHDPLGETSMLQDIKAGRRTENDWFCGTIVKLGEKHNIPAPACALLQKLVAVTEKARELIVSLA